MRKNALTFYDSPLSPCARRVRVTLAAKRIPHALHLVDLTCAEQKSAWYKAINPSGKVPAIRHNGRPLWESNIITQYLDEAFDGPPLYPVDPVRYAQVREWQAFEIRFAQAFFMLMYQRTAGVFMRVQQDWPALRQKLLKQSDDPAFIEFNRQSHAGNLLSPGQEADHERDLLQAVGEIETALGDERPFLAGDAFSQADISVYPRLRMLPYLGLRVDADTHPRCHAWMQRVDAQDCMRASMTANEQMMSHPLMLKLLRWAREPSLKPPGERSLRERLGLGLMRQLLRLNPLAIEKAANRLRKLRPRKVSRLPMLQGPAVAPARPAIALSINPRTAAGQALRDVCLWLGLDYPLQQSNTADAALTLNHSVQVQGLLTVLDVLYRACPQAGAGYPQDAYARARARIWVGGDQEGETKYIGKALAGIRMSESERRGAGYFLKLQLGQIEQALAQSDWLCGEFGFADIATACRIRTYLRAMDGELPAGFEATTRWLSAVDACLASANSAGAAPVAAAAGTPVPASRPD